jgi:hypothetical protein
MWLRLRPRTDTWYFGRLIVNPRKVGPVRLFFGLLAAGVALGGCSFIIAKGAPPRDQWPEDKPPHMGRGACTTSPVAPIIDAAMLVGGGVAGIYLVERPIKNDGFPRAPIVLVPALAYGFSAIYGFTTNSTCRTYRAGPPYPTVFGSP